MSKNTLSARDFDDLKWTIAKLREMMESNFYGELSIKLQDGSITHTETKKTEKPPR